MGPERTLEGVVVEVVVGSVLLYRWRIPMRTPMRTLPGVVVPGLLERWSDEADGEVRREARINQRPFFSNQTQIIKAQNSSLDISLLLYNRAQKLLCKFSVPYNKSPYLTAVRKVR